MAWGNLYILELGMRRVGNAVQNGGIYRSQVVLLEKSLRLAV